MSTILDVLDTRYNDSVRDQSRLLEGLENFWNHLFWYERNIFLMINFIYFYCCLTFQACIVWRKDLKKEAFETIMHGRPVAVVSYYRLGVIVPSHALRPMFRIVGQIINDFEHFFQIRFTLTVKKGFFCRTCCGETKYLVAIEDYLTNRVSFPRQKNVFKATALPFLYLTKMIKNIREILVEKPSSKVSKIPDDNIYSELFETKCFSSLNTLQSLRDREQTAKKCLGLYPMMNLTKKNVERLFGTEYKRRTICVTETSTKKN